MRMHWIEKEGRCVSSNLRFRIIPVVNENNFTMAYHADEYTGCRWIRLRSDYPANYGEYCGKAKLKEWIEWYNGFNS